MATEAQRLYNIERGWLKKKNRSIIVLLEHFDDWIVTPQETARFRELWNSGTPFLEICKQLGMSDMKVLLLIADQNYKGFIKPRPMGLGI